jgi:hypothetical protein
MRKLSLLIACTVLFALAQTGGRSQLSEAAAKEVLEKGWRAEKVYVGLGPMAVVGGMGVAVGGIKPDLQKGTISTGEYAWYQRLQAAGLLKVLEGPELAKQFTNWEDFHELTQNAVVKRLFVSPLARAAQFGCDGHSNAIHLSGLAPQPTGAATAPSSDDSSKKAKSEDGADTNTKKGGRVRVNWRALVQPPKSQAGNSDRGRGAAPQSPSKPEGPKEFLCIPRGAAAVDRVVRIMNSAGSVTERSLVLGTYHRDWSPEMVAFGQASGSAVPPSGKFVAILDYDPFKSEWRMRWYEFADVNQEFKNNLIEQFEHNALPK